MSSRVIFNSVADRRKRCDWTQRQLAERAGLSRAEISAIENSRVVPSTLAALALATALDCRVEDLFSLDRADHAEPRWAWGSAGENRRFWKAAIEGHLWLYPVEGTPAGTLGHDGIQRGSVYEYADHQDAGQTLVLAGCDPAANLLSLRLRAGGIRLLPLLRSSRESLELLKRGLVHAIGLHLVDGKGHSINREVVEEELGAGYKIVHVARWQEGIALSPNSRASTIREVVSEAASWVGREPGSGARHCQDLLFQDCKRKPPGFDRAAPDHRAVVDIIRSGWAEAGVCVRLPAEEARLRFLIVREEDYDICFPIRYESDPRFRALTAVLESRAYRRELAELPGYNSLRTGDAIHVG